MEKNKQYDLDVVMAEHGMNSRVLIDGEDRSRKFYRIEASTDINEATKVTLFGYTAGGGTVVIKGRLLVEEVEEGEPKYIGENITTADGSQVRPADVSALGNNHRQFTLVPKSE
jgi:hypothetical protein